MGSYKDLIRRSVRGDDLQIHHVPQGQPAGQVIGGYAYGSGTAIALPTAEHQAIPNLKGPYSGTSQDLVQRDLQNLRDYTKTPDSAINRLEQMINDEYFDDGC